MPYNKSSSQHKDFKVSVIIVNYNTGKLLQECIDSVIKSTKNLQSPLTEIIVVDNNSTDGSVDIKGKFKLIKNDSNPGFSKANNQGIKQAKGKYILLLNADTKLLGDVVNDLINFTESHPDAGAVVPQLLNTDKSIQDSVMPFPTVVRAIQEFWFGKKTYSKFVLKTDEPQEIEAAVMAAFLITPQALEKVGLLDEKYFMYFEDLDYCQRINRAELKIYYVPYAQVIHYHGTSGKNLATQDDQWKRLIPSSKIYNGKFKYFVLSLIIRIGKIINV